MTTTTTTSESSFERKAGHVLATWFGCGLSPIAPGTVGTIGALPLWLLVRGGGPVAVLGAALVLLFVGVWAGGVVAKTSRTKDPQHVVIDEVAGVFVALAAAPSGTRGMLAAVVFFRLFDMTKPFPARRAEHLPNGWGIMMDDIVAGIQAAVVVRVLASFGVLA